MIECLSDDVLERMMDNRTGLESRTLRGHSGPVYSTSYSPDKNYLTSASEDGTSKRFTIRPHPFRPHIPSAIFYHNKPCTDQYWVIGCL